MKVKTLSALAGIGATMILSGQAEAAFTGLSVIKYTTVTVGGGPKDVYRVYANFNNAGDTVQAVFGGVSPVPGVGGGTMSILNMNATGAALGSGFFDGATDVAPIQTSPGSPPPNNQLWATFATIGKWTAASSTQQASLSPGFGSFIAGNTFITANGAWSFAGDPAWTAAGNTDDGSAAGVGIMQLTVNAGENVMGTINLQINPGGALAGAVTGVIGATFNSVPAPGALALLGLAGLVGARRRRA